VLVPEIRFRHWSDVFKRLLLFTGILMASHWKCTVNLSEQNEFWSVNYWNWSENGRWPTVISSTVSVQHKPWDVLITYFSNTLCSVNQTILGLCKTYWYTGSTFTSKFHYHNNSIEARPYMFYINYTFYMNHTFGLKHLGAKYIYPSIFLWGAYTTFTPHFKAKRRCTNVSQGCINEN